MFGSITKPGVYTGAFPTLSTGVAAARDRVAAVRDLARRLRALERKAERGASGAATADGEREE